MRNFSDELAPIVLFVYNRPWHTQKTIEALQHNDLAKYSVLYVFADGAKPNATEDQLDNIRKTRELVHSVSGFKTISFYESDTNKGLANSIIHGVSKVVNKHGKVIVLEDDLVTSKYFLEYMNRALSIYKDDPQVMHISGYMYPIKKNHLPNTFFYPATSCWGWGTWKRAWDCFNPDAAFLYDQIKRRYLLDVLNINTIHGFEQQLKDNIEGRLFTWFIKWDASVILEGGYSLYPKHSLVQNVGFDGSGEHCGYSNVFSVPVTRRRIRVTKSEIKFNQDAIKELKEFDGSNISCFARFKHLVRRVIKKSLPDYFLSSIKKRALRHRV